MTRKKAFDLSIEKWNLIIENGGEMPIFPDHINKLRTDCGLCEKYWDYDIRCKKCPINLNPEISGKDACIIKDHLGYFGVIDGPKLTPKLYLI